MPHPQGARIASADLRVRHPLRCMSLHPTEMVTTGLPRHRKESQCNYP